MDAIKKAVAEAVQKYVNSEKFSDDVAGGLPELTPLQNAYNIEAFDTTLLQSQLRIWTDNGPRYFVISVSEQM